MGSGLYEAAFSTLTRLYGRASRDAITGITLIAGFASTVGWPLSSLFEVQLGWRGACFGLAALQVVVGLPLNAMLPRVRSISGAEAGAASLPGGAAAMAAEMPSRPVFTGALLALVFAITWFISTAMAAHLPRLLQDAGARLSVAVAVGALVGPAQVAGRLLEFGLQRRVHSMLSARLAALAHPVGAVVLMLVGAPTATVFALLHGAGNAAC